MQASDAEMKADGPGREQPLEGGRQQMLPGVLLHVIESPRPGNLAVHGLPDADVRGQPRHDVQHPAVVRIDDVDDPDRAAAGDRQRSGVEGLTAGGGIEGGLIEPHGGTAVCARRHAAIDASNSRLYGSL